MKNNPLLGLQKVSSGTLTLRSFWDVNGDQDYYNVWPEDRPLPFKEGAVVIIYTEQGKGILRQYNNNEIHLRGTSVAFLNPVSISRYWCDGGLWKLYWIEVIPPEGLQLPLNKVINIDNHAHFHLQFMNLISALQKNVRLHDAYAASLLNMMVHEWLVIESAGTGNHHEAFVHKLIDEMHLRLTENWQVSAMARFVGYSEQYLRKKFLAYMKVTPKTYFNDLKLEIIYNLLKNGGSNIGELAEKYGFTDAFHLSKTFKKKFGYPPSRVKMLNTPKVNRIFTDQP